jgi:hypothetical protein
MMIRTIRMRSITLPGISSGYGGQATVGDRAG